MCLPDPLENALEYFIDISFFVNFFVTLLKQFLEPLDNWVETVIQKKNAFQIIFVRYNSILQSPCHIHK